MKVVIDHFEGAFAIVELDDQSMIDMPRKLVPLEAQEGDVIEIKIDRKETQRRKKKIKALIEGLWE